MATTPYYLPAAMPAPVPEADGLDTPYWEATRRGELVIQRCGKCRAWQWGPEWICHACLSFEMGWERVEGRGVMPSRSTVRTSWCSWNCRRRGALACSATCSAIRVSS